MKKLLLFLFIAIFTYPAINADNILFEESFEDFPDFTIKDGEVGNWTIIDVDKADVYGIAGVDFPNNDSSPKSYMVFNSTVLEDKTIDDLSAYDGKKALIAFTPMEVGISSDDWLISPKVSLEGENLALIFQAKAARASYNNERFKVWILPATQADSKKFDVKTFDEKKFTLLSANPEYMTNYIVSGIQSNWLQLAYSLDAYEGQEVYLAIQHLSSSSGGFLFMLDDFKVVKNACLSTVEEIEVTDVTDSSAKISWKGNFPKYEILYGRKGTDPRKADKKIVTTNEVTIDELKRLTEYQYYIRPYCDNNNGSEVYMMYPNFFRTRLGEQPFEVNEEQAYYYGFEVEEDAVKETGIEYDGFEIHTAPGSGASWKVISYWEAREGEKILRSSGTPGASIANTWAFTGGLSLKEEQKVQISCWVKNSIPFNSNSFRITIGKEKNPDSEYTVLYQKDIEPDGQIDIKVDYEVPEDGTYYLGFHHCTSDGMLDLMLDFIEVKDHEYLKNEQQFEILFFDNFDKEEYEHLSTDVGEWILTNPDEKEKIDSFFDEDLKTAGFVLINSQLIDESLNLDQPINYESHSGKQALISFAASTPPTNDWMISPKILLQESGNILTFWAKAVSEENYNEEFKVMLSTTGTNMSDFSELASENLGAYLSEETDNHRWIKFVYNLDDYAGQNIHVAIRNTGSHYKENSEDKAHGLLIDDFKVVAGGCTEQISNVAFTASLFDGNTAFLSFTGNTPYYQVAFGKKGFTFNEDEVEFTTKRGFEFSDLEPNTRYEVYIRACCDIENPSEIWFGPYEIHTISEAVQLPYEYGFETDDITNDGWRISSTTGIIDWKLSENKNSGEEFGEKCIIFSKDPEKNYSEQHLEFLFTPAITILTGSTLDISFAAKIGEEATSENLQLVWNDVQEYTPDLKNVEYFDNITNKEYTTQTCPLIFASYAGIIIDEDGNEIIREEHPITFYIGFYVNTDNEAQKELIIDNLVIRDVTVGIENPDRDRTTAIQVYPNPTTDVLNIKLNSKFNLLTTNISISDVNGRRIKTENYTPRLSVSDLPSGIYTLTVSDGNNQESKLFIKE